MISSVTSATTASTASIMFDQQIQSLNAQVVRLESKISGLQEKIFDVQENERLSADEKKEQIRLIKDQINQLRDRVQDVHARISETQQRQIKAEKEERKQQKAADERTRQTQSREEAEGVDRALLHAIIGIDQKTDALNQTKSQLNSRLREATKEEAFRVRADGKMVMIPKENRRPRDPAEAKNVQSRINNIDTTLLRDNASKADALKRAAENHSHKEPAPSEEDSQNEKHEQRLASGTGRMEKGQFLEDEA